MGLSPPSKGIGVALQATKPVVGAPGACLGRPSCSGRERDGRFLISNSYFWLSSRPRFPFAWPGPPCACGVPCACALGRPLLRWAGRFCGVRHTVVQSGLSCAGRAQGPKGRRTGLRSQIQALTAGDKRRPEGGQSGGSEGRAPLPFSSIRPFAEKDGAAMGSGGIGRCGFVTALLKSVDRSGCERLWDRQTREGGAKAAEAIPRLPRSCAALVVQRLLRL